jgi:hypothetical protein
MGVRPDRAEYSTMEEPSLAYATQRSAVPSTWALA